MFKRSMVVLLAIAALAAGLTIFAWPPEKTALPLDRAEQEPAAAAVTVYVSGAVAHPGVVTLAGGSRVEQAVEACGGVLPTADMERVNLAQPLKDGMQVRVSEQSGLGSPSEASSMDGRVNINTADAQQLDTLPGIGPAMAQRIIEYRTTQGAFQSPEEIEKVKGIGAGKYEKLKDRITI